MEKTEENQLPRILINVNETWSARFQIVLPAAIDTLTGLEQQCMNCIIGGEPDAADLVERLQSQLIDLRRNLESIRLMF